MGEIATQIALKSFARAAVTIAFRVKRESITVPSGPNFTTIVEHEIPKGYEGFLLELGHDANAVMFENGIWRITVDGLPVDAFGGQTGEQWGTINDPGTVFGRIGNGKVVALEVRQASGGPLTASAILVGYSWPINNPATPVQ